jgi:hypothetical protein
LANVALICEEKVQVASCCPSFKAIILNMEIVLSSK